MQSVGLVVAHGVVQRNVPAVGQVGVLAGMRNVVRTVHVPRKVGDLVNLVELLRGHFPRTGRTVLVPRSKGQLFG